MTGKEAVARASSMVNAGGQYKLGTGDYRPVIHKSLSSGPTTLVDLPWTGAEQASDCAGFAICWCWKLTRHRPGFNKGSWSTVEDDINVNSMMEDATHKKELAEGVVTVPRPGDLICYPTFYVKGVKNPFIGHVALIEGVPAVWVPGRYDTLAVIQCHGPNGFRPGVVRTDGSLFLHHDHVWPQPERQCRIVRMRES